MQQQKEMFSCKISIGKAAVTELYPFWEKLENSVKARSYSHSLIWNRAYLENLADDGNRLVFCTIWNNKTLIALFPFEQATVCAGKMTFRTLSLSQNFHYLLPDILVADGHISRATIELALRELKQCGIKWDVLFFPRVLAGSTAHRIMAKFRSPFCHRTGADPCNTMPIQDYERIHQSLAGIFRGTLKKAKNKLNRQPAVEFISVSTQPEIAEAFARFLEVEASGWKGNQGENSAILLDHRLTGFYRDVMEGFAALGQAAINLLKVGDKVIAAQYTLGINDTLYLLKIGYDQEFSKLSPGNLLLEWLMKRCQQEKKYTLINFITSLAWQNSWNPVPVCCYNIFLCNTNRQGLLLTALLYLKRIRGFFESLKSKEQPGQREPNQTS